MEYSVVLEVVVKGIMKQGTMRGKVLCFDAERRWCLVAGKQLG